jgi:scyllo-inositol 2-dehydrogenase (NADP+)
MSTNSPIRVGIAGLGRSGWNIHGNTLSGQPHNFQIISVTDGDPARRKEVSQILDCRSPGSIEDLLTDPEVELVVVATPNAFHGAHTIQALKMGKHVVVEKPAALSCQEMDAMIVASKKAGRLTVPFQQRRYEPHFQKAREIVNSGRLGRILHIRLCWHGFKRRWDWQTLREFSGGSLNNNGPHLLDHALEFLPEGSEPEVFCDLQQGLSLGDAEDHVKIVLKTPDAPTIDIELSDVVAFPQDRWLICGTKGGLSGTETKLHWKWIDWNNLPTPVVERTPPSDRGYNSESLLWHEERWEAPASFDTSGAFYHDLYQTLRHNARPFITLESVRRRIAVMEQCHKLNPLSK